MTLFILDYEIPKHLIDFPELISNFFKSIEFLDNDDIYLIKTKESEEDSFDEEDDEGGDVFNSLRPVRRMIIQSITGQKLYDEVNLDKKVIVYLRS